MSRLLSAITLVFSVFVTIQLWAEDFDPAAQYQQSCAVCHKSGVAGAPRTGDTKAWEKRLEKGESVVLNNVKNGIGAMPAKGMCGNCSDAEFKALIDYMSK